MGKDDAKQCPWCGRWCLKDDACAYVFACGLDVKRGFVLGGGCGRTWCWTCGKKYCSVYCDSVTGKQVSGAKDHHDAECCRREEGFREAEYCGGGHSGHCGKRW